MGTHSRLNYSVKHTSFSNKEKQSKLKMVRVIVSYLLLVWAVQVFAQSGIPTCTNQNFMSPDGSQIVNNSCTLAATNMIDVNYQCNRAGGYYSDRRICKINSLSNCEGQVLSIQLVKGCNCPVDTCDGSNSVTVAFLVLFLISLL